MFHSKKWIFRLLNIIKAGVGKSDSKETLSLFKPAENQASQNSLNNSR